MGILRVDMDRGQLSEPCVVLNHARVEERPNSSRFHEEGSKSDPSYWKGRERVARPSGTMDFSPPAPAGAPSALGRLSPLLPEGRRTA